MTDAERLARLEVLNTEIDILKSREMLRKQEAELTARCPRGKSKRWNRFDDCDMLEFTYVNASIWEAYVLPAVCYSLPLLMLYQGLVWLSSLL